MNSIHRRRAVSLVMLVVYDHPRDFPHHFVVRAQWPEPKAHDGIERAPIACLYDTLDAAMIDCDEQGLTFLMRNPQDDPVIVGVWL